MEINEFKILSNTMEIEIPKESMISMIEDKLNIEIKDIPSIKESMVMTLLLKEIPTVPIETSCVEKEIGDGWVKYLSDVDIIEIDRLVLPDKPITWKELSTILRVKSRHSLVSFASARSIKADHLYFDKKDREVLKLSPELVLKIIEVINNRNNPDYMKDYPSKTWERFHPESKEPIPEPPKKEYYRISQISEMIGITHNEIAKILIKEKIYPADLLIESGKQDKVYSIEQIAKIKGTWWKTQPGRKQNKPIKVVKEQKKKLKIGTQKIPMDVINHLKTKLKGDVWHSRKSLNDDLEKIFKYKKGTARFYVGIVLGYFDKKGILRKSNKNYRIARVLPVSGEDSEDVLRKEAEAQKEIRQGQMSRY